MKIAAENPKRTLYGFLTVLVEMGSSAPQDVEYLHGERVEASFGDSSTLYSIGADDNFCRAERFDSSECKHSRSSSTESSSRRFSDHQSSNV